MICPHCGKEIVTPVYAEPANTAGQPLFVPVVMNGNSQIPWINTVCAAGGAAPVGGITGYLTLTIDGNDKR